jgi:hypothetical protein
MVMKFNPQSNRFENVDAPLDITALEVEKLADMVVARSDELQKKGMSRPQADSQARKEIMAKSGSGFTANSSFTPLDTTQQDAYERFKELTSKGVPLEQARTQANLEFGINPKTTTPTTVPKEGTRGQGKGRTGSQEGRPTSPSNPRVSPSTTVPRTTGTTAPPRTTTTTAPPRTTTTTAPPRVSPTTTAPVSPTTTVPRNAPTTTVPANSTTPTTPTTPTDPLLGAFTEWVAGNSLTPAQSSALGALGIGTGGGGGGGGSSGPSTAQKKASARIQTQAGKKAQAQYNALAQSAFNNAQAASQGFYKTQAEQANTQIDAATKTYLENLIKPTAYSNASFAQLAPQQQGLLASLQAYGATGQQAQQQQAQDTEFNRFLTQLMTTGAQSLQTADQGYFDALRNAGTGGQAAARLGVTQNTTAMQNQSTAQAEAIRQQLIQAGIQALMAGQSNAANTLAS